MILIFRLLSKDKAAETFTHMEKHLQESLIHSMTDKELRETINEMFTDDAVDIIEEMPSNIVKRILANISPADRKIVNELGFDYVKQNFQYSILENYNARIDDRVILERENWWKETLQSRAWGYNSN